MIIPLEVQKAMHEQTFCQDSEINRLGLRLAKHLIHADHYFSQKCLSLFWFTHNRKEVSWRKCQHICCFVLLPISRI